MRRVHCAHLALPLLLAVGQCVAADNSSTADTVGSLSNRRIEVRADGPSVGTQDKAMENYEAFLKLQNADPRMRAEALRRLGDNNLESGELDRLSTEVTQIDKQGAEAIRLYTTLLKAYPDYPRNDQVLYQLARAYETTGQSQLALATEDRIVKQYPNNSIIPEVQFRRGELLFSAKRYAEAESAYAAVIAAGPKGSTFYQQSLYKHGWSLFKQAEYEDGLESFAKELDILLTDKHHPGTGRELDKLTRAEKEYAEDTLSVMSVSFSYMDGAKSIDQLLAKHGAVSYAWLLYSRLGNFYVEKNRFQDAATTYRAFVAHDPIDAHAPNLSMQAIQAYSKGGFTDLVLEGKKEYVRSYGFGTPYWANREHAAFPEVVKELKTNLHDLAEHYHATAQQTKKQEDYSSAAGWYRDYLAWFPDDPESAETNYLLAEALFESHQYTEAAAEYERTAYHYPTGARSATAGYAALVSYEKQEPLLPAGERAAWHAKGMESGLKFAQTFPEHPESAVVLTHAAQDVFASGDLPRAVQVSQLLLSRNPPVDVAKQRIGWTIIGQSEFNLGVFDQSEAAFSKALALTPASAPEHADLSERLAAAVYKQGEAKRKAGDEAAAADDFLRVASVAPGSKVIVTAQYDAAAALITAKQWDRAIGVLEAYRHDYPNSQYSADVTDKLAVAYVEAGRPGPAAVEFEHIAARAGEDPALAREATMRAADLYEKSGNAPRTTAMLELFVERYPTPIPEAIEARERLRALAAKAQNSERVSYWQREIVRADAAAGAARTDRTRFLASQAKLALAEPSRDAFRAIRLVAPLKKTLADKKQALEAAVRNYDEVIAYRVADTTTAATYEKAELYRTLAHDLLASERPKKLTPEERDQYDSLLEEQADPIEEQAIKIHEVNTLLARDGVYDESVRKSFQALAELSPGRYGKTERSEVLISALPSDAGAGAAADLKRAVSSINAGQGTEAELQLKQMELQYPKLAAPSIDLGLLARRAGHLADSEAALHRACEAEPNDAPAWSELGITLREEGKFADARKAYEQAISVDPDYAPAHRNLGVLLDLYLGDPATALGELVKYQTLANEQKPVSGWIAELRNRTGIKAPADNGAAAQAPAGAPGPESTAPAAPAPATSGGTS
jgi:tetratricopeptide (TPR) repeat protein